MIALAVAWPTIATCVLLATLFDKTLLDYFPDFSDELAYYHQIGTFARAGFNGGYYSFDEMPAPFPLTHFSAHGPAFPVLYGLPARVVGWTPTSGPIFNLVALAIATTVFIVGTRQTAGQIAATGIAIGTSWWLLMMASSTMQETLNQAFMIVIAAFAVRLLRADVRRPGTVLLWALAVLAVASVLRPTNWIVAVPLAIVGVRRRPLHAALAAFGAILGIPLFWFLWRYLSAPIPDLALEPSRIGGVFGLFGLFWRSLQDNFELFALRGLIEQPFSYHVLFEAAALTAAAGLLVVMATVRTVMARRRNTPSPDPWTTVSFNADIFNLLTLGAALLAFVGFYVDFRASISRVAAPFLLLSLLVLVGTRCRVWIATTMLAANLLIAPSFVEQYREWRSGPFGFEDRGPFEDLRKQMEGLIRYVPGQDPWCNTMLTMRYPREILTVPAGIGLSVDSVHGPSKPRVKSRYLLLADDGLKRYGSENRLRHLSKTAIGDLYLNLDVPCLDR